MRVSKTYIHVNGQDLRRNEKRGGRYGAVFVVAEHDGKVREGTRCEMTAPSRLIYDPENAMRVAGYGAVAWIEVDGPVRVWWGEQELE
jgi:hypothetical protein